LEAAETDQSRVANRGAQESLVESFAIDGLYGYRDISLSSQYAATILIAKNGSGKTTLLGALNAFLKGRFSRLQDLNFKTIRCKLRNVASELVLSQDDVAAYCDVPLDSEVSRYARSIEVEPSEFFKFLTEDFEDNKAEYRYSNESAIFNAIERRCGYRYQEVVNVCEKFRDALTERVPRIAEITRTLKRALEDIDIVYLPTYRRIELPLSADDNKDLPPRRRKPRFRVTSHGLFTGDIQFGLADISDRLSTLNQRILFDSNQGYREISASIINELIDGTFEREATEVQQIPDKEELELFFSRLKEGRRVGPFNDVSVPNIDKIYTGEDISFESNRFLRYFLVKLDTVIKATRDIEGTVQEFIHSCNRYLSGLDLSASTPAEAAELNAVRSPDAKELRLNRRNLSVHVESLPAGRKIPLDALSSGEKQMISLFAKLYLYPRKKLVLIDEPELSLSIDWQRQILVDVLSAPLCTQVIAITHSPFVFDNALEPFARSIHVKIQDVETLPEEDSEVSLDD
jgi:predicted ATPase